MIIKAAIIGTHGTFKTTLTLLLSGALKQEKADVYTIQEIAQDCPYPLNGVDIRAQEWIILKQYFSELEKKGQFDKREETHKKKSSGNIPQVILCDRSTLDAYIYTLDLCKHQGIKMPGWMPELVCNNMPSYDFLFLASITPGEIEEDSRRSVDPVYQKTIDYRMKNYLKKKKIGHLPLDYNLIKNNPSPSNSDFKKLHKAQVEFMVDVISKKWKK